MTIFFYGPNSYALRAQLGQMVEAYLKKTGSNFGLERLDGSTLKGRELLAAVQAAPFLATSRLVIIEGAVANKPLGAGLEAALKAVPASTVAIFVERDVDQRTTAFKVLKTADKVVKFEPLTGPKLFSWIKTEVQRLGGEADAEALHTLVDMAGEDQWRLQGEITKLVNYQSSITPETVRELVVPSVERSIFELVEAMTAGRTDQALVSYHGLLKQKESEMYVLTMAQWQLRNLLLAKTAPAAMPPSELAKAAGMSPYVAGKMAAAQSQVSEAVLTRAYQAAAECEYDIKSGRTKAEAAVEQLIYQVATAAKA